MNPIELAVRVKKLYQQYSQASQETKNVIQTFFLRFEGSGALPLGVQGTTYHWVTIHAGTFPFGNQRDYITANTPVECEIQVHRL